MSQGSPRQRGRQVQSSRKSPPLRSFYLIIGAIAVVGVVLLLVFVFNSQANPDTNATADGAIIAAVSDSEAPFATGRTEDGFYYKGDPEAPVQIVEYSDFQCPACANFTMSDIYERVTTEYVTTGQVQFVFHDFPLQIHPNAPVASEAAYCAGAQGYYWAMHEEIFRTQQQWSALDRTGAAGFFGRVVGQMGLDSGQFESCMSSDEFVPQVEAALESALQNNIPATPTFVVDGTQINNALQLTSAIDAALAASE